jgi:hypothetical protein
MADPTTLDREVAVFQQRRSNFLKQFPGLFVLIKGDNVEGPFPTAEVAYEHGLREYGIEPFLVKQVLEAEPVGYMPMMFSARPPDAGL